MLQNAVQAIYTKIQTSMTDATPEELAYLGTALEKLGGRATVYDVMQVGDDKIAEIGVVAVNLTATLNTDADAVIAAAIVSIDDAVSAAQSSIDDLGVSAGLVITDLEDALTNAESVVLEASRFNLIAYASLFKQI
jgi:hypothetical protein